MNVSVRPEAEGDAASIHRLHAAAFPTDAEARLVDSLRGAGKAVVSLVGVSGESVVGHVLFSPVSPGRGLGLAPIAVLPEFQKRGIGAALIEEGIETCRKAQFGFLVVLGAPGYYTRFGFRRALDLGLENEYGARDEFMVLELRPGGLAGVRGLVKYAAEFAVFG